MSSISEIKVTAGGTMIVPKSMIERHATTEVSAGGFLIILEEGQTLADAESILKEHNRAKLERDRLMLEDRRRQR
jgi:hypothetical protein